MVQVNYNGVDTEIPISKKNVLRIKENNGQYSAVIMDMHALKVEHSDWYSNIEDLNKGFLQNHDIALIVE